VKRVADWGSVKKYAVDSEIPMNGDKEGRRKGE